MELNGFLLINKPINYSSYDCIRHIKKIILKRMKIGHAGTLDKFAKGLLVIAIGRESTKNINLLLNSNKEYLAQGKLGELTDTLDHTGEIIKTDNKKISKEEIQKTLTSFLPHYQQTPPMYSALKYKGKSFYDIVRKKEISKEKLEQIIQTKTRVVHIYKLDLINFNFPFFTISTKVSKGTYIRSLINDIAKKLNTAATCYSLTRTKIGKLSIKDSIDLTDLNTTTDIKNNLIPIDQIKKLF